jgi:hypothetical protein
LTRGNYGTLKIGGRQGRDVRAHIAAWRVTGEPIPPGYFVCHTCDNRVCVRNDEVGTYTVDDVAYPRRGHLFCAPRLANIADAVAKGRTTRGEANPRARLTEALVREIRQRVSGGETIYAIAAELGIAYGTAYHAARGRNWKYV